MPESILVTGGLGFIGSHACAALLDAGYRVTVLDNLRNAKPGVLGRLRRITGKEVDFHRADVRDERALDAILAAARFDAVIHFAGLKAVGESVERPLDYYDNNVGGTVALLRAMAHHGVRRIVFSSSATVYGEPERLPYTEEHPLRPQSPYGRTKLAAEQLLADEAACDPSFAYAALRYFNPVGAHPSGLIGEDPRGIPGNLFPYLGQVAVGRLARLPVFGNDYPTPDGTGVRDYIHVMDLAAGHLAALTYLATQRRSITVNLGTGRGYSVLEVLKAFEQACARPITHGFLPRRPGDLAAYFAEPSRALRELGWRAERSLAEMCRDAWRWQSMNPSGVEA